MIVLTVLSSEAFSSVSKKMRCEIEYKSYRKAMATFYLDFEEKNNLDITNLTFELVSCKSAKTNCKKQVRCNLYKRSNISNGINCTKNIDLLTEITSTSTSVYHVLAGDTFITDIGRVRDLQCICKDFDLNQNLAKKFLQLGKVDVKIEGFYNIPKLEKTNLIATPSNTSSVKRISNKQFQVSASDLCQTYNLTVTVESKPTCTNWKIKSNVTFPLESNDSIIRSCQYNHTIISINTSAENDARVYYTLNFEDEQCIRNVAKELTCPAKRMKIQSKPNITAFIKLCIHGCNKCGKEKDFICYSTISKSLRNSKTSIMNTIVIFCSLGGLILFIIIGMILWFKCCKTRQICDSDKDEIRPRHTTESLARILMQKDDDYVEENDRTYEMINKCHHYNKPDISFKDIDSVSKKTHGS